MTGDPAFSMFNLSLKEDWINSKKFCHRLSDDEEDENVNDVTTEARVSKRPKSATILARSDGFPVCGKSSRRARVTALVPFKGNSHEVVAPNQSQNDKVGGKYRILKKILSTHICHMMCLPSDIPYPM